MNDPVLSASKWFYDGVWGVLARAMLVPRTPPSLPLNPGEEMLTLHPAEGYLRYLKLEFWLGLLLFDGVVFVLWLVIFVNSPAAGLITSPFAFVIAVVPDIIAYVGIHVLYDTTWYIITPRSLRIRAGIWVLKEMTFTFENVQNVTINQGPLQRFFGIADVVVETAGGSVVAGPHGVGASAAHRGVLTGIDNADKIRSLIRERAGQSRTTGLGDEAHVEPASRQSWGRDHVEALREIRNLLAAPGGRP